MSFLGQYFDQNRDRLGRELFGLDGRLSSVMLTPRFRASAHVVYLVWAEGRSAPVAVVKVPRLKEADASIRREAESLRQLQSLRPGGFDSVPRVVAFEEHGGWPLLIETALAGRPMDPPTVRRRVFDCCDAVLRWLSDLQATPDRRTGARVPEEHDKSNGHGRGGWFHALIEEPLAVLADALPLSADEQWCLDRTRDLSATLRGAGIPLVVEHGDLSHPNVMLLSPEKVGVVDWELAQLRGLPACDWFFFLTYASFARWKARKTGRYLAAFEKSFFGPDAWTRPYVARYARTLALDARPLAALFVLCWARYFAGLASRLRRDHRQPSRPFGGETADWLRGNRYYALWRYAAEHVDDLAW